jgi:hypothetical protein
LVGDQGIGLIEGIEQRHAVQGHRMITLGSLHHQPDGGPHLFVGIRSGDDQVGRRGRVGWHRVDLCGGVAEGIEQPPHRRRNSSQAEGDDVSHIVEGGPGLAGDQGVDGRRRQVVLVVPGRLEPPADLPEDAHQLARSAAAGCHFRQALVRARPQLGDGPGQAPFGARM